MRLPAKCRLYGKVPKFPMATALQHCKLSMRRGVARLYPVYWLAVVPFISVSTI